MRVIAGSVAGIELRAPGGRRTRPTTGRLRESLFGMLEAAEVDMSSVLDLYAGSGALGIEALSRGGGRCTFVEVDRRACTVLRENLERTKFSERADVVVSRVDRWRPPEGARYTLVVADPPYDVAAPWDAVESTVDQHLAADAVIVVEHAARVAPAPSLAGRTLWRDRRQGDGAVAVYRKERQDTR